MDIPRFFLLSFLLIQRTSGGSKSLLPATSAANCCIASNTNLRFACPNSKLRKQRRTRDTRQIGHGHVYGSLNHKLRWMLLLREPTLHLQLQDEKKEKLWMANRSASTSSDSSTTEALLGQAVGEKLDRYRMPRLPEGCYHYVAWSPNKHPGAS